MKLTAKMKESYLPVSKACRSFGGICDQPEENIGESGSNREI